MYFSDSDAFRARKSQAYFKSILARIINDLRTQTVPEAKIALHQSRTERIWMSIVHRLNIVNQQFH